MNKRIKCLKSYLLKDDGKLLSAFTMTGNGLSHNKLINDWYFFVVVSKIRPVFPTGFYTRICMP